MAKGKSGKKFTWIICIIASLCVIATTSVSVIGKIKDKQNEEPTTETTQTACIDAVIEA